MAAHLAGAQKTTITDMGLALGHLQKNIDLNGLDSKIDTCELDWFNPSGCGIPAGTFDVIIGSEVIYREPLLKPLVETCDYHLKRDGVLYLVSARDRGCYLYFFHIMAEKGYKITTTSLFPAPLEKTETGWCSEEMSYTASEELTVGWFCEGQVCSEMSNLILVTCRKS